MEISTPADLSAWCGTVDVFLVGDDLAAGFGLVGHHFAVTSGGVEVARYDGPSVGRVRAYEELNSRFYRAGEIGTAVLWEKYIEPLYRPARDVVVVDKYCGPHVRAAKWLWQEMAQSAHAQGAGRNLTLLSSSRFNSKPEEQAGLSELEKADWLAAKRRDAEDFLAGFAGTPGIATARLLWVPDGGWTGRTRRNYSAGGQVELRKHERHIRFDKRVLAVSSGMEWIGRPGGKNCWLSYRCKGDWQPDDYEALHREEVWLRSWRRSVGEATEQSATA